MRQRIFPLLCSILLAGIATLCVPSEACAGGARYAARPGHGHHHSVRSRTAHRMRGLAPERHLAFTDGLRRALPRERRLSFTDGDAAAWPDDRHLSYADGDLARLRPRISGLSFSDPPFEEFDPEYYEEAVEADHPDFGPAPDPAPGTAPGPAPIPRDIRRGAPPGLDVPPPGPRPAPPKLIVVSADRDERVQRPMHTLEMNPWMLLEEGYASSATKRFAARAQIQPERPLSWIGFALATADRGRPFDAARLLRRAVDLDPAVLDALPKNPELHTRIGLLLADARVVVTDHADDVDLRTEAGFLLATLLYLHDDREEAGVRIAAGVANGDTASSTLALRTLLSRPSRTTAAPRLAAR